MTNSGITNPKTTLALWRLLIEAAVQRTNTAISDGLLFPKLEWLRCLHHRNHYPDTFDAFSLAEMVKEFSPVIVNDLSIQKSKGLGIRGVFGAPYECLAHDQLASGIHTIWGYTTQMRWVYAEIYIDLVKMTQIPRKIELRDSSIDEVLSLFNIDREPYFASVLSTFSDTVDGICKNIDSQRKCSETFARDIAAIRRTAEEAFQARYFAGTKLIAVKFCDIDNHESVLRSPYSISSADEDGVLLVVGLNKGESVCNRCARIFCSKEVATFCESCQKKVNPSV